MNVGILRFDTLISASDLAIQQGEGVIKCSTNSIPVVPGSYFLNIALSNNGVMQDYVQHACNLSFLSADFFKNGRFISETDAGLMKVLVPHTWRLGSEKA
jgi:hypothetical protein